MEQITAQDLETVAKIVAFAVGMLLVYRFVYKPFRQGYKESQDKNSDPVFTISVETVERKSSQDDEHIAKEAQKLVEKTNTLAALEKLKEGSEAAEERLSEIDEDRHPERYAKEELKWEILERAYCDAACKPIRYYFCDDELDIYTPPAFSKYIGKLISPQEYELVCREYGFDASFEEVPLESLEDIEQIKEDAKNAVTANVKEVISLWRIFESTLDREQKEKKFNKFVENSSFLKDWFDTDSNYFGEYVENIELIGKVKNLGTLPNAKILVKGGYETLESIINASDKELLLINGIGAVKLAEIRNHLKENY